MPWFGELALDAITYDTVERYIAAKLTDGERIREAKANGEPIMEKVTDKRGRTLCVRCSRSRPGRST